MTTNPAVRSLRKYVSEGTISQTTSIELSAHLHRAASTAEYWAKNAARAEVILDRLDEDGFDTLTEEEGDMLILALHGTTDVRDVPADAWHDLIHHRIAAVYAKSERAKWDFYEVPHVHAAQMLGLARTSVPAYLQRGQLDRADGDDGGVLIQSVFRRMARVLRQVEALESQERTEERLRQVAAEQKAAAGD